MRGIRLWLWFVRNFVVACWPLALIGLGAWMLYNDYSIWIRLVGAFLVLLAFVMTLD